MNSRLNRLGVVVLRLHLHAHRVAGLIDVTRRLRIDVEGTVGGQHRGVAGHFAIGRVGNSRLNAVIHIARLGFHGHRQRDGQLAIGVEHAFLFLLLGLVPGIVRFALIGLLLRILARVRVFLVPPVMLRGMNHVLHLHIGNRLAKEVARIDHRLNLVSL